MVAFSHWKVFFVLQKPHIGPQDCKEGPSFQEQNEASCWKYFSFSKSTQSFDNMKPCSYQMFSELSTEAIKDAIFA